MGSLENGQVTITANQELITGKVETIEQNVRIFIYNKIINTSVFLF